MKCIKLLFSIKGIKTNIGFYSSLTTIIVYIITLFIFYLKDLKRIMRQIDEIMAVKKMLAFLKDSKQEKKKEPNKNLSTFHGFVYAKKINLGIIKEEVIKHKASIENDDHIKITSKKNINQNEEDSSSSSRKKYDDDTKEEKDKKLEESEEKSGSILNLPHMNKNKFKKYKHIEKNAIRFNNKNGRHDYDSSDRDLIEAQNVFEINKVKKEKFTSKQKIIIVEILKFNDTELNELGYRKAIKYDLRNYKQYYISLLLTKHNLFKIFNKRDYNSYSIKVLLLFFNFSSCYAVNALFFNDNAMHQIYEDEGKFNFIYQLPQIAYSTIISYFIDNLTTFLGLSEDNIIELKKDKNLKDIVIRGRSIKDSLKIKFIFFFILSFCLILLLSYYLGCFCAVYKKTQFHLIKDTLVSFSIGSITPIVTNMLTTFLRIYSLRKYTKGNQMIFSLVGFCNIICKDSTALKTYKI